MQDDLNLFWQASLSEIKQGYSYRREQDDYVCLICGRVFLNGVIYQDREILYQAEKYVAIHIMQEHGSVFQTLLGLDKKLTGLTEHQRNILDLFYTGQSDQEIAKTLNSGSVSTIRNHRFALREKYKQAKVFTAIMELLAERSPQKHSFVDIPRNTRQVDERFAITLAEQQQIVNTYFNSTDGVLKNFPRQERKKVAILRHILDNFNVGEQYTEAEVNAVLKPIHSDYAVLRRYLIDYGFLERENDGSLYWVKL